MNRIVLIGNGFDLANGYKTSYTDFIEWLMEKKFNSILDSKYDYEDDDLIYKNHDSNIDNFQEFRSKFFIDDELITFIDDEENVYNNIDVEYKNSLLRILIDNHFIQGWADIESLYYENLNLMIANESSQNEVLIFQNNFQRILNLLQDYLSQLNRPHPDMGMRFRFKKVLNSPIVKDEISIEYISEVKPSDLEIENGLILDFNYTDTTTTFYDEKYRLIHIHGELNSRENPMIFGFGDELDDNYSNIEKSKYKNDVMRFIKSVNYLKNDNYRQLLNFINFRYG